MKLKVAMLVGALVFAGVACSSDKKPEATNTPTDSKSVTVQANDALKFDPVAVTATVGTTVTWKSGSAPHSATSTADNGKTFDVDLPSGGSGSFTFTKAGTYAYYCKIHGKSMSGTITVQ